MQSRFITDVCVKGLALVFKNLYQRFIRKLEWDGRNIFLLLKNVYFEKQRKRDIPSVGLLCNHPMWLGSGRPPPHSGLPCVCQQAYDMYHHHWVWMNRQLESEPAAGCGAAYLVSYQLTTSHSFILNFIYLQGGNTQTRLPYLDSLRRCLQVG